MRIDVRPHWETITGAPRWAKIFGTILFALFIVFLVLRYTVFGGH